MVTQTKRSLLWLKIFIPAFLLELLFFASYSGMGAGFFTEPFAYLLVLGLALAGLVIGLLIIPIIGKRRAALAYISGHLIALLGTAVYLGPDKKETPIAIPTQSPELLSRNKDVIDDASAAAMERVIYSMEEQYPYGAYEIVCINTEFVNGDSSGHSGSNCTIVFRLDEEDGRKYISRYFVKGDSLAAIYTKKDTNSREYKEYLQNNPAL